MRNADSALDLDSLVQDARQRYTERHQKSADWVPRAKAVLPGGETRSVLGFVPFPFRVERADKKFLYDVDGNTYVDLLGNYTAGLLGHSPEPVKAAVERALENGWAMGAVGKAEVQLAELVTARFDSMEQVRFTNSGTEANLMALALALHHTQRTKVLVCDGGYHGGVLTFGSHGREVNVPHDYLVCGFNDPEAVTALFLEQGSQIGAVLVEPMQGSAGCIPANPEFLSLLRSLSESHGALLIFDEVMTSRLSVGGAQMLYEVSPDLTTLGKYVGGGFSFGAFGGSSSIMSAFDLSAGGTLGHAGTFNNNVISMHAGVAALSEMLTAEVLDHTNRLGDRLRVGLNDAFMHCNLGMCVTGLGSLLTVHGTSGPVFSGSDLTHADNRLVELLFFDALANGYYMAPRGFIALSIEITEQDVDGFVDVVRIWAQSVTAN